MLCITELAVYNLGADRSLKRRIPISGLAGVSFSEASDEFVLHVPAEYDYRFVTTSKALTIEALRGAAAALGLPPLIVNACARADLKDVSLTRVQAGLRRASSGLGFGHSVLVPTSPTAAAAAAAAAAGDALAELSLDGGGSAGASSPSKSPARALAKKTRADSARVLVLPPASPSSPAARKLSATDFSFAPSPDIGDLRPIREGDEDDD